MEHHLTKRPKWLQEENQCLPPPSGQVPLKAFSVPLPSSIYQSFSSWLVCSLSSHLRWGLSGFMCKWVNYSYAFGLSPNYRTWTVFYRSRCHLCKTGKNFFIHPRFPALLLHPLTIQWQRWWDKSWKYCAESFRPCQEKCLKVSCWRPRWLRWGLFVCFRCWWRYYLQLLQGCVAADCLKYEGFSQLLDQG